MTQQKQTPAPDEALLTDIAARHKTPLLRNSLGEPQIRGKFGHIYVDAGKVVVCFTDCWDGCDGSRKQPLTARRKQAVLLTLRPWLRRLRQEGDTEFVAEIDADGIAAALRLLRVRRHRNTHGISRPFGPPGEPVKRALQDRKVS